MKKIIFTFLLFAFSYYTIKAQCNANAGTDQTVCGNVVTLVGSPNGNGISGYWTGPAGVQFSPSDTSASVSAVILPFSSTHNETFWWHQTNGICIDSDQVVVLFNPYAGTNSVSAGFDNSTCDSLFQLHGIVQPSTLGTGQWSSLNNQVIIDNSLNANTYISIDPATVNYSTDSSKYNVTMTWTVSNGTGCTAVDNVVITFYQTPHADAGMDQAVCGLFVQMNTEYSISASVGQWSLFNGCSNASYSDQTSPSTQIQVSCYGTYTFIWRENNLYNPTCSSVDTIKLEFLESPTISAGDDQWVCGDSVYLHASTAFSLGYTWGIAPVTWVNVITHLADTLAQRDSVTIAYYQHTLSDSIPFVWQEWNPSTLPSVPTTQCISRDTVIVHFFIDHPAIEWVDSEVDSVQCGRIYDGLNTDPLLLPEGYGYWVDTIGATIFTPDPFSSNATATIWSYGMHHFYWVVKNGTRPNGSTVCIDSSDVIPIRFIENPVANAGDNIWEANPDSSQEIKWDTVCGNKYTLNPILSGLGDVQWIMNYSPSIIWFKSTHTSYSPMPYDTVVTTVYNSGQTTPPYYYEVILQLDNSLIPYPPYSHSCIDRDTLRITFAPIPTGNIEFRKPYCYGQTALIYPEYDPQGKPNHFTWSFYNGIIDSTLDNFYTPTIQNDSMYYVSWDSINSNMFHFVSLVTSNSWGCISTGNTDTIWEPAPVYPLDSVFPTTCMQANGTIKVFPSTLHPTTNYYWLDPEFASNPIETVQNNLLSGTPYHLLFKYEAMGDDSLPIPNVKCMDTITYIIPDISSSSVSGNIIYPGSQTDQFSATLYNTAGPNGWHLTRSTPVTGGSYHFTNINSGTYAIKIINETMNSNILSTYYQQSVGWQQANTFTSACDTFNNFNIHMISLPDVPGNGTVSGMISYDPGTGKQIGEPVPGAYIYLNSEPADVFAKYTISNDSGYYEITNVHNGSYSIYVDIPGLPQITTHNFSVSNTNLNFPNLNFVVDTNSAISKNYGFGIYVDTSIISVKNISASGNKILVFPNPASDFVNIQMQLEKVSDVTIEVIDVLGRKYKELKNTNQLTGSYIQKIDVRSLQSGVYILKVTLNNKTISFNLVR